MYIVIIEWDGEKPPTAFYRRLNALAVRGVRVNGDKDVSVLERRLAGKKSGIVVQEGAIIVPTESLARVLALLARKYNAAYVQVGHIRLDKNLAPTVEDAENMRRVESILGRRGRPGKKMVWTVSCRECLTIHRIEAVTPVNCPSCGGLIIGTRIGEPSSFLDLDLDIFTTWLNTRFANGVWEPALLDGEDMPPVQVNVESPKEQEIVETIRNNTPFLEKVASIERKTAIRVLDAIFVARAYWTKERRQNARIESATLYFQRGGDPTSISLAESDTIDILDAAGPLGIESTVGLLQTKILR